MFTLWQEYTLNMVSVKEYTLNMASMKGISTECRLYGRSKHYLSTVVGVKAEYGLWQGYQLNMDSVAGV